MKKKQHGFALDLDEAGQASMYLCDECGHLHANFTAQDPLVMMQMLMEAVQQIAPVVKGELLQSTKPKH